MTWKGFKDVQATVEIDLTKDEEELWNKLDKDARRGVKKAKKSNLIVKENSKESDWKEFYEIYKETCKYGKIVPLDFEEIKKGKLFSCYLEKKLIAGAVIKDKEKKITLFLNASLHEFLKYKPNNILYWEIILWGKKKGKKFFDLGGYQLNAESRGKLDRINKFKMRWGGEIKKYYVYSYNPIYILGRKIIRNFHFVKKIRDSLKIWKNKNKLN